jgi:hypothetical protein
VKEKFWHFWEIMTADKAFKIYYLLTFIWFIQVLLYINSSIYRVGGVMQGGISTWVQYIQYRN